jgi:glycerol-3-phosphate dehydrogenase subunit B
MTDVIVVGAGVAATAAALASARGHARVVLVDGGTGASSLATGAIDALPWNATAATRDSGAPGNGAPSSNGSPDRQGRAILEALGGYALPDQAASLLTTAGVVRRADGHDAALLNVAPLAGRLGVVRCERPGWDAAALAAAWGDAFLVVDATVLRYVDERVLPDADFAARSDDDSRLGWLSERLREALARAGTPLAALVLPPSLGVERARAAELSARVGVPCGEPIAAPGGPAGLRFERARDRALAAAGVERVHARASEVTREGEGWSVGLDGGDTLRAGAVVLATGGLIGGGIEYAPSEAILASVLPPFARAPFRATVAIEGSLSLGVNGRPLELPGSLFGVAPESIAWPFVREPAMERVGVLVDADGRVSPGLYAAGDLVADAPRTWLRALESGARAGANAARDAATASSGRPLETSATGVTFPSRP